VVQPLRAFGLTHASSVMPFVRLSSVLEAMVTQALVPLNDRAPPYLPAVFQVALLSVPVRPWPEHR